VLAHHTAPVAKEDSGAPEWEVERILDHRTVGRSKRVQYLVEWKGYPIHEATWEPIEHLDNALDTVIEYNQKKKIDLGIITIMDLSYSQVVQNGQQIGQNIVSKMTGSHTSELRGLSSILKKGRM
jgi:hypothetical protein